MTAPRSFQGRYHGPCTSAAHIIYFVTHSSGGVQLKLSLGAIHLNSRFGGARHVKTGNKRSQASSTRLPNPQKSTVALQACLRVGLVYHVEREFFLGCTAVDKLGSIRWLKDNAIVVPVRRRGRLPPFSFFLRIEATSRRMINSWCRQGKRYRHVMICASRHGRKYHSRDRHHFA